MNDVFGVDGVDIPRADFLAPFELLRVVDLTRPLNLGRKFDMVLCLEVAEHIDEAFGAVLVETLTRHSDRVVFSAACPNQPGQHHVNCQWPEYWQALFNRHGFACDDDIRWKIWNDRTVDQFYRQNMFIATREPERAGREERVRPVIHPELLSLLVHDEIASKTSAQLRDIEQGMMGVDWHLSTTMKALASKIQRRVSRKTEK